MDSVVEGVTNKDTMERKRCLPPWMLGITASDKEKSSKKQDNICISVDDEQRQQVGQSEHASSGIKKNLLLPPVKDVSGDAIIRIRKSNKRTFENVNIVQKHEDASEKKQKSKRVITRENNAANLKRRAMMYRDSENSTKLPSSQSCSDIELSLDDLESIAEEYVRAEAENDVQKEAGNELPSMSRHETKSEEVGMDFTKKGSLVNDVWKPQEHKKLEPPEYMTQNHKLSDNLYSGTVEGEEAPPMKKKGSLKEKQRGLFSLNATAKLSRNGESQKGSTEKSD